MRKWSVCLLLALSALLVCGCRAGKDDMKKLRDIDYTVVSPDEVPEELMALIEEEKEEPFMLTYGDKGFLYLARGYGEQETSGYSVEVEECYETEDVVFLGTELLGPSKDEEIVTKSTYPYVAVKMEFTDKDAVFD